MHQVDAHEVLWVRDGFAATAQLTLLGEFVGDALGLHPAQSLRVCALCAGVVEAARVKAGISAAQV